MNISKRKKVLIFTPVLLTLIIAVWILGRNFYGTSEDKTSSSGQKSVIVACDTFSLNDAKKIFGDDIFQNSLDARGEYKISTKINDAPKTETALSACAYTKNKLELNKVTEQPAPDDIKPVPEGKQKPVDLKPFLDALKKEENSQAAKKTEFLAVITIRSTTEENAKEDFNRPQPKSAQSVSGLGKTAFWNSEVLGLTGKKQGSLSVLAGDKTIIVSGDNLDIETAKKIANSILDRL